MTSASSNRRSAHGNVSDLLRTAAATFPDRPAVIDAGRLLTWAELDRAADHGGRALVSAGLTLGDRVIVSLDTSADLIAALFAVARAGLVAVPISPARGEVGVVIERVAARGAIAGQSAIDAAVVIRPEQVTSWWHTDAEPFEPLAGGEDIAILARAAGSDRPVMISHRAVLAAVAAIGGAPRLHLRSDDRAILVLPAYHLAGWVTAFLPLCAVGAAAVVPDQAGPEGTWVDAVLATIRSERVTIVPGAPGLYRRLTKARGVERALASVRLMTSGAAPLDPGDSSAIRALTAQPVWEGYGISESSSVVSTSLMSSAARTGSVGLPLPGIDLRIVGDDGLDLYSGPADEETDQAAEVGSDDLAAGAGVGGEVGRVQITGPTLFSGYWPDRTGGPDESGWFTTGDLGYLDDRGELHLVDREAETIRVAGFTVYPREIEDVLAAHPYVRDAAVVSAGGPAGDAVVAVLVPLWGTHPTTADLDDFVAARLPNFKRPQRYLLVDRLPRTEIGRIDRQAVSAVYRSGRPLEPAVIPDDESAELAARALATEPRVEPEPSGEEGKSAVEVPGPEVRPEAAAPLEELGSRLPGTGERRRRGDDDTDDDLF